MIANYLVVGSIAAILGMAHGRWAAIHSLLIGADSPGRTPHKLGDNFYYLVPESEYVRCRCRMANGGDEESQP